MYWIFYGIPLAIFYAFLGINSSREEDFFTWFLNLNELGIYDGMYQPYENQFSIPEGVEYHARNIDTGFQSKYGMNSAFAKYEAYPEALGSMQDYYISSWYRSQYPEIYDALEEWINLENI